MLRCKDSWLNVAEGGKRAGKNVMNIAMWCSIVDEHDDMLHLIAGVTSSTAKVNILDCNGFGVLSYFEGRIVKDTYMGLEAYYVQTPKGEKIIIPVGGGNIDSHERIQGFTIGTCYLTEAILLHRNFIEEVQTRMMTSSDKKLFMDLNPEPPGHPFYTEFLDIHMRKKEENPSYEFNYEHFTIFDNTSISNKALKKELDRYDKDSIFYKMDILGKRIASFGRIYTSFDVKTVVIDKIDEDKRPFHFSIGVDVGGTDATVAVLTGFTQDFKYCTVIDGYYNKQGSLKDVYDEGMFIQEVANKIEEWSSRYNLFNTPIYCDSAAKTFRSGLRNELARRHIRLTVHKAYKKDGIVNRIRLNSTLISKQRFFIFNKGVFKPWIEAYENASWCEKAFSEGEWKRIDDGSVPIDCLDATEYAIYPFTERLLGVT